MILEEKIEKAVTETLNNFLSEYRPHTTNKAKKVSINEVNAKSMLDRHGENGFIVISPCRGCLEFGLNPSDKRDKEKLAHINKERVKDIINKIKDSGYSYTPVYGGFIENQGTENEESVYERSFVIYNRDKRGNKLDMNNLFSFGLELANIYNQDSFLVKAPDDTPKYYRKDGSVTMEFNGKTTFNDVSQEYFTDLHKNTHKFGNIDGRRPTRFSYVEAYINPGPQDLSEANVRYMMGEVFLPYR